MVSSMEWVKNSVKMDITTRVYGPIIKKKEKVKLFGHLEPHISENLLMIRKKVMGDTSTQMAIYMMDNGLIT